VTGRPHLGVNVGDTQAEVTLSVSAHDRNLPVRANDKETFSKINAQKLLSAQQTININ